MNQTRIHQLILSITLVIGMILSSSAVSKEVENLLMDPDFEESVSGWNLSTRSPAAATLTIDTKEKKVGQASARIEITNVGDGSSVHNLTLDNLADIAVEANKTYTVDFWTKAEADRTLILDAILNQGPWTRLFQVRDLSVTKEWTRIHHTFQANATLSPVVFLFSFVDSQTTIWLDHVRFYEGEFDEEDSGMKSAFNPYPADGATDVPRDVTLRWTPGEFAPAINGHMVYLSENFNDVNEGIDGITRSTISYAPPQRLDFETTYYWRVDEVNAPPDSTIFKGSIWSFTTEPVSYAIEGTNIMTTASSAGEADFGPEKTVDGSGLDAQGLHSTEPTDMWLSGSEPQGAWIQYEFGAVYKLHEMWVWNSNQVLEAFFGFGLKEVTVEYSTNGTDWIVLAGVPEFAKASGKANDAHSTTVDFGGAVAKYVRLTATSNWGGVLPQYGLSEVRFFYIPVVARGPSPDSGASDVHPDVLLSWRAGREAATHDVYLSSDQQAVIDSTAPVVNVADASYSTSLELGNTYYWRIDEVNEAETPSTWQGDVWDFTTRQFIVVEDFEDYNDYPSYEIYSSWLDGYENPTNGSQAGYLTPPIAETTIVHGGGQSMPLLYSNTGGATYSEATRTFAAPQDWTQYGIQTFVLYFYGDVGNTGQLYLKVNGVKVPYSGTATDIALPLWNQWNIDLAPLGTNLRNVTTLSLGVDGNGAGGTLYVDDMLLYRP